MIQMAMDILHYMTTVGIQAREASRHLARADTKAKNTALSALADAIRRNSNALLAANLDDLAAARAAGMAPAMLDRLTLSEKSIVGMAAGIEQVAELPDPIGEITDLKFQPSGIQVGRMRVPLGVV